MEKNSTYWMWSFAHCCTRCLTLLLDIYCNRQVWNFGRQEIFADVRRVLARRKRASWKIGQVVQDRYDCVDMTCLSQTDHNFRFQDWMQRIAIERVYLSSISICIGWLKEGEICFAVTECKLYIRCARDRFELRLNIMLINNVNEW